MNCITLILAAVLSLAFTQVTAQDFDKGEKAFRAGDYTTAIKEWKPLAEQGNASAQYNLGWMYEKGKAQFFYDYIEALKWYRLAAEQGNAKAQNSLGLMYESGTNVLQDNQTSHMWYNIASANGHENAGGLRNKLEALMTASDVLKATAMAKECMNSNYKKCGYLPAFTHLTDKDFRMDLEAYDAGDYATAMKEWKTLAEQGNASAQRKLGIIYELGRGVLKDNSKAAKWYRLSAEQGDAFGQNSLGRMYGKGQGVLKDTIEAEKWYRLAAEQGYARAQSALGYMYENGLGVPQDNQKSHMWYNIASANGRYSQPDKDKVSALMSAEDISKATAMAKECMNSNYKKCGS